MLADQQLRGGLLLIPASLLLYLSCELLKWQFPAHAAGEKLAAITAYFRTFPWSCALQFSRD